MNQQTPQVQPIPVTFISGNTFRILCRATLPALPFPGDFLDLGILAYQVTGHNWRLTPDGSVNIQVVLVPRYGENGERPFTYPEEKDLAELWATLAATIGEPDL
jgi:hypothetical protein